VEIFLKKLHLAQDIFTYGYRVVLSATHLSLDVGATFAKKLLCLLALAEMFILYCQLLVLVK
jgi:hypothetical protein